VFDCQFKYISSGEFLSSINYYFFFNFIFVSQDNSFHLSIYIYTQILGALQQLRFKNCSAGAVTWDAKFVFNGLREGFLFVAVKHILIRRESIRGGVKMEIV
jgi:hypothetical protein